MTTVLLLAAILTNAQTVFESGYFIDNFGKRTECLINNVDWNVAPRFIEYKTDENSSVVRIEADNIKEFSVGRNKYVKAFVKYDNAEQELKKLTPNRNPEWAQGELMLKVLVDGKAVLYHYHPAEPNNFNLFFFSVDNGPIEQLVFKNYLISPGTDPRAKGALGNGADFLVMTSNLTYINQLNLQVKCEKLRPADPKYIKYTAGALTKYFVSYNSCVGVPFEDKTKLPFRLTNIRLKAGVAMGYQNWTYLVRPFAKESNFRVGVELEVLMPFKNRKWAMFFEPTFQSYEDQHSPATGFVSTYDISYRSIEFPLGVRHYFYLGRDTRIFINGAAVIDVPSEWSVTVSGPQSYNQDANRVNLSSAWGGGLAWKRLSAEYRYYTKRQTFDVGYGFLEYYNSAVILGFKIN